MKISFINTPLQDYSTTTRKEYRTMAPLGLGYLATIAQQQGHYVELIDGEARGLTPEQIADCARDSDVIGINLLSPTINVSRRIIDLLAAKTIIAGGPHATAAPNHALETMPAIDLLIRGEGEFAMQDWLERKPYNQIGGVSYRSNGSIIHTLPRQPIQNLDDLPFVDRSFVPEQGKASVMTTRGCPFTCIYCSVRTIAGNGIRTRSIQNIVEEIGLIRQSGIEDIHFVDDNFIFSRRRALELASELGSLPVRYRGLARADLVARMGEQVMSDLQQSGLYQLTFGLESGNPRILNMVQKGITVEQSREAIDLCKRVGIKTKGYFMLGFPTETEAEIQQTIEFAKELELDEPWFVITRAYPGTKLFDVVGSDTSFLEYGQLDELNSLTPQEHIRLAREGVNWQKFVKYGAYNQRSLSSIPTPRLVELLREAYSTLYLSEEKDETFAIAV